jgi:hypothetical protein
MSRMIWGACCAVFMVVLLSTIVWLPAGADEADDPYGKPETTATDNAAKYQEILLSPEIAAERAAERRINKILDTKLKAPLEYLETPLDEIASILQEDYDIPILFDVAALDEVAISPETEISVNLRSITLRAALDLMLMQVEDLAYSIRGQVLIITTEDAAAEHLEIHVYRVDDILDIRQYFNGTDTGDVFAELIYVIIGSVESDSWETNGSGTGEIQPLQPGMLVITQTQRVHRKIVHLLADIRLVKRQINKSMDRQTMSVHPITRGFKIDVEMGEKSEKAKKQIAEAVKQSVDWDIAKSGLTEKDAWLQVLPNRLLVRHLPDVVYQVEHVVLDMKLAKRDPRGHRGGHSPGGGGKVTVRGGGGF